MRLVGSSRSHSLSLNRQALKVARCGVWFGVASTRMAMYGQQNILHIWLVVWLPSILCSQKYWISNYWLVVWLPFFYFPRNIGFRLSSQLTNSYFSEGWPWPTNLICFNIGGAHRFHREKRQIPRADSLFAFCAFGNLTGWQHQLTAPVSDWQKMAWTALDVLGKHVVSAI